jgi:transcription elongation factor Elf1
MDISDIIAQFTRMTTYYLDSATWREIPGDLLQKYLKKRNGIFKNAAASKHYHFCPVCGHSKFISAFDRIEEKSDNSFFPGLMTSEALICSRCGALEVIQSRSLIFREMRHYNESGEVDRYEYVPNEKFVGVTIEMKTFASEMHRQAEENQGIRDFVFEKK